MRTPVHSSCFFLSTACDCIRSLSTGLRIARDAREAADLVRGTQPVVRHHRSQKVCAVAQPGAIWCNPDCAGAQNEPTAKLTCEIHLKFHQCTVLPYYCSLRPVIAKHPLILYHVILHVSLMKICHHSSTFHKCSS